MAVCAWCKVEHDPNEGHKTKDSKIADLLHQLREAQGELLVAKRNAESWQETAQQAQAKAEAAEALLEAAWLQSGHPHFQTWYKSLTPAEVQAQKGEP